MIKIVGLLITILLVVFYDYLPKRTLLVYPGLTQAKHASTDSWQGGASSVSWHNDAYNEEPLKWTCHMRKSDASPYCGIYLTWSENRPYAQVDFSLYSEFEVKLDYEGKAKYIQLFYKNAFNIDGFSDQVAHAKYASFGLNTAQIVDTMSLPFDDFHVADWWISLYDIPPSDIKTEFDEILLIGFDFRPPMILGDHQFTLHSLRAVGNYFSKEIMYLGIIILWATLLVSEGVFRYAKLYTRNKENKVKLSHLTEQSASYKKQSETDTLTAALNRHGLNRIVTNLQDKNRLGKYSLLIIDIDHFKAVNDKLGHHIGDAVLSELSATVKNNTRYYDFFARWGGEEFVILFRNLGSSNVMPFAEKIRQAVEETSFADGQLNTLTISIGATKLNEGEDFDAAFRRADKGLYEAKKTGRNKAIVI